MAKTITLFDELKVLGPTPEGLHKALNILNAKAGELSDMTVRFTSSESEWGAELSPDELRVLHKQDSEIRLTLAAVESLQIEMHRRALESRELAQAG